MSFTSRLSAALVEHVRRQDSPPVLAALEELRTLFLTPSEDWKGQLGEITDRILDLDPITGCVFGTLCQHLHGVHVIELLSIILEPLPEPLPKEPLS